MPKSEKNAYKVSCCLAKNVYKKEKAAAKYAYKLEKSRLKFALHQQDNADHPKPGARLKAQTAADIRRARQAYKNRKAEEKTVYLQRKSEAKLILKKQQKWAADAKTPASLSFSLAAAFVLVFLVIMIVQEVFVLWMMKYITNQQSDSQLTTVYAALEAADFSESAAQSASVNEISFVSLVQNGEVIYLTGDAQVADVALGLDEGIHEIAVGGTNYRLLCRNNAYSTMYVAKSMQIEDNVFALLLVVMSVATVLAAIASGVVGISVSQKCLRPVHSMSRLMKEMTVSDLSARLDANKIHTELRDVARHYNQMMDRLEASYAAQSRFVSDASHELRTPLSIISGYADILSRWGTEEPEVMEEAITAINAQCRQMNELLERLLTLSRMDSTLPEAKATEIDIYELLQEITKDFSLVAGDRDIMLSAPKAVRLTADVDMLRQCLVIFLDNAVKFTEQHGQITVFAAQREGEVRIGVRDDGIGIAADQIDKVFDRFYKADPARGEKGYGLGLSIAARLADAMGARVDVTSVLHKGAEFVLIFPR